MQKNNLISINETFSKYIASMKDKGVSISKLCITNYDADLANLQKIFP